MGELKGRLPVAPRAAVQRMHAYHPPLEGRAEKLALDFNENTVGCSPRALAAIRGLSPETIARYPEYESARRRLAKAFHISPANLLVSNGTDDALRLCVDTFADAGDAVAVVEPTFAMYRFYSEIVGARVESIRYGADLTFPMESVLKALRRRPKLLFLANPNNPTGTLVPAGGLTRILDAAVHTMVVVDEAYADFSGLTVIPWVKRRRNLIVTRTFSKAAGLAGLRVGALFIHRDVAMPMRKAQPPYAVNAPALAAAVATAEDKPWVRRYAADVVRNRTRLESTLRQLGIPFLPSAANFILMNVADRAAPLLAAMRLKGILLRDRKSDFGREGWIRVTVGSRTQMARFTRALEAAWRR